MAGSLTLTHAYEYYTEKGGTLDYKVWRKICETFNEKAVNAMLEGKRIDLPGRLGFLNVIRKERDFTKPRVNWGASRRIKKQLLAEGKELYDEKTGKGERWLVYYTDDFYCRFRWSKKHCKVRNKSVYKFVPTRGKVGAKNKLADLLQTDELAYTRFEKL